MVFNTSHLTLQNFSGENKLVTVRRTLQTGRQEDFLFRVNDSQGWQAYVRAFAGTDTGTIEIVQVVSSPLDGTLDNLDQIQKIRYQGQVPGLHNISPRPLFIGATIYDDDGRRPSTLIFTLKPYQDIPTASEDFPVRYEWHAAELQKASLYPPYFE